MINYLAGVHTRSERQQTPAKFYGAICPGDVHFLLCSRLYTRRSMHTAKWTANEITLDDTGVNFSSLPHIAIKSRPTEEKYANSMPCILCHELVARRIRTWGFGGACAVVVWRGPPPHIPPSSQQLSSRLFTRLSRTQPAEHGPSAGIACTHTLSRSTAALSCPREVATASGRVKMPCSAPGTSLESPE